MIDTLILKIFAMNKISRRKILHEYAKLCIGKDMSPIEDELGCAEALNNVVQRALGKPIGGGASTYYMAKHLTWNLRNVRVYEPKPGDIIISPTGHGNGKIRGHVGIMGENETIMSNNSYNSKWESNYTLGKWKAHYQNFGGLPVKFYRVT